MRRLAPAPLAAAADSRMPCSCSNVGCTKHALAASPSEPLRPVSPAAAAASALAGEAATGDDVPPQLPLSIVESASGDPPALYSTAWPEGTAEPPCAAPVGRSAFRSEGPGWPLGGRVGCWSARSATAVSCGSVVAPDVSPALLAAVAFTAAGGDLIDGDCPIGRGLAAEVSAAPSVAALLCGAAVIEVFS